MTQQREVWVEEREPRRGWRRLPLWLFVGFNVVMAFDVARVVLLGARLQHDNRGNGIAAAAVQHLVTNKLVEHAVTWAVLGGVLGLVVLATRGERRMIHVREDGADRPPPLPPHRGL